MIYIWLSILIDNKRCIFTHVRKMDSDDDSVSKRSTRRKSLKYMVKIIEKRGKLSLSGKDKR